MAVTAVTEVPSVASITGNLQALLNQAKTLKPSSGVDPALPSAELIAAVDSLDAELEDTYGSDQAYRFEAIASAAREQFYAILGRTTIDDPEFVEVWNLLDVLTLAGDRGKCPPELSCSLIEELLDSQTTVGCRTVFDYLESRRERLARKDFHKKNLFFLRSCNELLRRLSRAEDATFCGRVFFFLFQTFPLGDKSSVNLRGDFHIENSTKFDLGEPPNENGESMDVDQDGAKTEGSTPKPATPAAESTPQPSGKPGSRAVPIKAPRKTVEEVVLDNSTLYPIFWQLQQNFSDPTRLFAPDNFQSFKKGLGATLLKFKKTPCVQTGSETSQRKVEQKPNSSVPDATIEDPFADNYNPKYLTSRDLFDLELSDLAFQRHILVQAMILLNFLLSLTEQSKKKLAALETTNRSMLYPFTLNEEDAKWATATQQTIKLSLQTSKDGRFYDRMVETVLARDKNWVRWKVESCPSIIRDAVSAEQELEARENAKSHKRKRAKPQAAMNWSFLVESGGGGLEALKEQSRYSAPSMNDLMKGIEGDKLDLEMSFTDEETNKINGLIDNKSWRVIRDARVHRLGTLGGFEPGKDLKEVFKQPEKCEEAKEEKDGGDDTEQVSKTHEQTKREETATTEGQGVSHDQQSEEMALEQPSAEEGGDPKAQAKPPTPITEAPVAEEGEKMQTD